MMLYSQRILLPVEALYWIIILVNTPDIDIWTFRIFPNNYLVDDGDLNQSHATVETTGNRHILIRV